MGRLKEYVRVPCGAIAPAAEPWRQEGRGLAQNRKTEIRERAVLPEARGV